MLVLCPFHPGGVDREGSGHQRSVRDSKTLKGLGDIRKGQQVLGLMDRCSEVICRRRQVSGGHGGSVPQTLLAALTLLSFVLWFKNINRNHMTHLISTSELDMLTIGSQRIPLSHSELETTASCSLCPFGCSFSPLVIP